MIITLPFLFTLTEQYHVQYENQLLPQFVVIAQIPKHSSVQICFLLSSVTNVHSGNPNSRGDI